MYCLDSWRLSIEKKGKCVIDNNHLSNLIISFMTNSLIREMDLRLLFNNNIELKSKSIPI